MLKNKRNSLRRLMAMMLTILMLTGPLGSFGSMHLTFAEEQTNVETTAPEITAAPKATAAPEITAAPEVTPAPEITAAPEATAAPEITAAPEATAAPEITDAPEVAVDPTDVEETPLPEQTAKPSEIETVIMRDGYAYVRGSTSDIKLYRDSGLTQWVGTIQSSHALLCATEYEPRANKDAAVLVSFDTKDGRVRGYVSEQKLQPDVVSMSEVKHKIDSEHLTIEAWQGNGKKLPLFEAKFTYANKETSGPEATHSADALYEARITLSKDASIKLRKTANQNAGSNGTAANGSIVSVTEEAAEWCRVVCEDGKCGYIRTKYLTKITVDEPTDDPIEEPRTVDVVSLKVEDGDMLNVYAEADTAAEIVAVLKNGSHVQLLRTEGDFAYIRFDGADGGTEGYVSIQTLCTEETDAHEAMTASKPWKLVDAHSGISVLLTEEALPEGVTADRVALRVRELSDAEKEALRKQVGDAAENAQIIAYDIALIDTETGSEFQPVTNVDVSMPIPEGYEGDLSVYHMEDGDATQLDAKDKGGECRFSTESFSPFVMLLGAKDETVTVQVSIDASSLGPDKTAEESAAEESAILDYIDHYRSGSRYGACYEIYRNGSYMGSGSDMYANSGNNYTVTWTVPKYDSDGKEYTYTVRRRVPATPPKPFSANAPKPSDLPGSDNTFVDTWTMDASPRTVTATIYWEDLYDRYEKRPTVEELGDILLSYGDEEDLRKAVVTKNANGTFTAVWENVPCIYNGKVAAPYTITEPGLSPVYKTTVNGSETSYTIRNTLRYKGYTAQFSVNTTLYPDYEGRMGYTLPKSLTATLYAGDEPVVVNGEVVSYVFGPNSSGAWSSLNYVLAFLTCDDEGNDIALPEGDLSVRWSDEFEDMPSATVTITNSATAGTKRLVYNGCYITQSTPITWIDENNQAGVRPAEMNVTLLANGEPVPGVISTKWTASNTSTGYPNDWRRLPQFDADGKPIHYSIQVDGVPEYYTLTFSESPTFDETNGYSTASDFAITEKPTFELKKQTATATVYWEGEVGTTTELKNRPQSVQLTLMTSKDGGNTWEEFWGTPSYSVTAGANPNEWVYNWNALPAVDAEGNPVVYKVVQNQLPIYSTTVDDPVVTTGENGLTHSEFKIHNAYNDNWNFYVDMAWNVANPAEKYEIDKTTINTSTLTAQYYLTIGTQKAYEPGELKVRIPYELFDARNATDAKGTVISGVSVGEQTNPSSAYNFTYYIDDKGTPDTSDDDIVFYNHHPLSASDNTIITVQYDIDPTKVVDCSVGSLKATATGKFVGQNAPETQTTPPITYRLDTGANLTTMSKRNFQKVYFWNTDYYGPKPADFDTEKYNYVTYVIYTYSGGNQPYDLVLTDKPSEGGEVILVQQGGSSYPYSSSNNKIPFTTEEDGTATWKKAYTPTQNFYNTSNFFYVMVRYNREKYPDPENEGQYIYSTTYHNDASASVIASDKHDHNQEEGFDYNDVVIKTDKVAVDWTDYVYVYSGQLISEAKYMSSFPSAGITILEYGSDISTGVSYSMQVYGYNLTDGYHYETYDDALYAYAKINGTNTDYVRLTEEDYELIDKPWLTFKSVGVDRTNGEKLSGMVPEEPFTVWGRKSVNGAWEKIETVAMKTSSTSSITMDTDLTGKGYVAIRVTSPDGLKDEFSTAVSFRFKLKGSSPLVKEWLKQGEVSEIRIENFAGYKLYAEDGEGNSTWHNSNSKSTNSLAAKVGLDGLDVNQEGAYVDRRNHGALITPVKENSRINKSLRGTVTYDVANELINAQFTIAARQIMNTNALSKETYKAWSQDDGVFYDLLPPGYSYNAANGLQVWGANSGVNSDGTPISYGKNAAIESVQTIDDYKGTGRQMVIFRVKSLESAGTNYGDGGSVYTGFAVSYWAQAGYDDVPSGVAQYNVVAFQRGDDRSMKDAYTERGYGETENATYYPKTEDGERVLYDVNGDGVVDGGKTNTLYTYRPITATFLQTVQNGLSKQVKANAGYYKKDDLVDLSGDYSYRLRFQTSDNSITKNVVIYDILENAVNTGGATGEPGDWRGTFVSASARSARNMGIDPVIWYSTDRNLSYNDENTLLIENVPGSWSTTPPADLSTVTAVAFDLRYSNAEDKTEFEFLNAQSVELFINMVAPPRLQDFELAYNRPAFISTYRAANMPAGTATTSLNISSRTTLALRDLQNVCLIKQYMTENEETGEEEIKPLAGVTFNLYQCTNGEANHEHSGMPGNSSSCWGSKGVYKAVSDTNGKVEFKDLDSGTYAFVETATRTGFRLLSNRYWVFTVNARQGTVTVPEARSTDTSYPPVPLGEKDANGCYSLMNERMKKNISINKCWYDDSTRIIRPKNLTFDLYRYTAAEPYQVGDAPFMTKEVALTSVGTYDYFTPLFAGLYTYDELGNFYLYKVVERPVEGYTADNNGTVDFTNNSLSTIYNRRMGVLELMKTVNGSATQQAFEFTVTLQDDKDVPRCPKDADGNVIPFTVHRYAKGSTEYTVEKATPDEAGTFTISLKDGEMARIIGVPNFSKWKVTEAYGNYDVYPANGTMTGGTSEVNISKASFTNTPKPAALALPFEKLLTGNETPTDKTFNFKLTRVTSDAPMPASPTASVTGAATGAFGSMTFTKEGVYEYTVSETPGTEKGYTYDPTSYAVTVTVTDNNGKLEAVWAAKKSGVNADALVFTNNYTPTPVTCTIPVKKSISGSPAPVAKNFVFTLAAVDGAPMPASDTIAITGAGEKSFAGVTYTAAGTYTYTLTEEDGGAHGYTYDTAARTIVVTVVDRNGALSANWTSDGKTVDAVKFTNNYEPDAATLELPVTKVLTGSATPSGEEFQFTLTAVTQNAPLPSPATLSITGAGSGTFPAIAYTQTGEYTYRLAETKGSAAGYTYDEAIRTITVTVTATDGMLSAAWKLTGDDTATTVTFTNNYRPAPTTVQIPVRKTLTGNATPGDKTFRFTLVPQNNAPMPDGAASLTAEVIGAGTVYFAALPFDTAGSYSYTVTEVNGNEAGYTYDAAEHTVTVTVTDAGGSLAAAWTVDGVAADSVSFANTYAPVPAALTLSVTKAIQYIRPQTDKDFTFTLSAVTAGAPMPSPATLTITGAATENFGEIRYTQAGTYQYTLVETEGSDDGYTYDATEYAITVVVTDTNGVLSAAWTAKAGEIGADALVFTNNYKPLSTTLAIPVKKAIEGSATPADKAFTFTMTAVTAGAPLPTPATITINGAGEKNFADITFDAAGTYSYTIAETDGGENGYTYDATVYTVTVTVTDQDGRLEAAWKVNGDDAVQKLAFTNAYRPAPATLRLPVKKTVAGSDTPEAKEFSFTIAAVTASAPLPDETVIRIIGAGKTAFGAITFTQAGEYTYSLTETNGGENGYTYDTAARTVTVTVVDNNGTLEAGWKLEGNDTAETVEFTNTYQPAAVELTIPVTKQITGSQTPENKVFTFDLKAKTANAPMPDPAQISITGAGNASFAAITFEKAGQYRYELTEQNGGAPGYGYDLTARNLLITVTDTDGELKYTMEIDDREADGATFVNSYSTEDVKLSLPVEKIITGHDTPEAKAFRFILTAQDGAPMPRDAEDGTSSVTVYGSGRSAFGQITYTAAGVYNYTVREEAGTENGYTYDDTEYNVVVTVVDQNSVLSVSWTANDGTQIVFTNAYKPAETTLSLPVTKRIDGKTPEAKEFSFVLEGEDGAPMPEGDGNTASVTGAGQTQFGTMTYTTAGIYRYTVREAQGAEPGYTYDSGVVNVTVTVTDTDGRLNAVFTSDGGDKDEIVFVNAYAPAPVSVEIGATKILKNKRLQANMFSFILSDADGKLLQTVTNDADGRVEFKAINYTQAGTYVYTITEKQESMTGVTYDTTTYTVTVTVTDENGTLKAEMNREAAENVFTNTYKPTTSTDIPKTGDGSDRLYCAMLLGLAALAMLMVLRGSRKKTR